MHRYFQCRCSTYSRFLRYDDGFAAITVARNAEEDTRKVNQVIIRIRSHGSRISTQTRNEQNNTSYKEVYNAGNRRQKMRHHSDDAAGVKLPLHSTGTQTELRYNTLQSR